MSAKATKKTKDEPKLKRGKPMNLYLHAPDEARIRELGAYIYRERGKVSDSQVVKSALMAADADDRLLKAFDVVKSRDLRFKR